MMIYPNGNSTHIPWSKRHQLVQCTYSELSDSISSHLSASSMMSRLDLRTSFVIDCLIHEFRVNSIEGGRGEEKIRTPSTASLVAPLQPKPSPRCVTSNLTIDVYV